MVTKVQVLTDMTQLATALHEEHPQADFTALVDQTITTLGPLEGFAFQAALTRFFEQAAVVRMSDARSWGPNADAKWRALDPYRTATGNQSWALYQ